MTKQTKITIGLIVALFLLSAFGPVLSQSATAIICRFESTACVESWGSNILVYPGQPNATLTPSFKVVATSGSVYGKVLGNPTPNQTCLRSSATITDTVSYTSTVTAITTPTWAGCDLQSISGDAARCGAVTGSGIVTITVRNAAATPAANAAGALVNYQVCGTNP